MSLSARTNSMAPSLPCPRYRPRAIPPFFRGRASIVYNSEDWKLPQASLRQSNTASAMYIFNGVHSRCFTCARKPRAFNASYDIKICQRNLPCLFDKVRRHIHRVGLSCLGILAWSTSDPSRRLKKERSIRQDARRMRRGPRFPKQTARACRRGTQSTVLKRLTSHSSSPSAIPGPPRGIGDCPQASEPHSKRF